MRATWELTYPWILAYRRGHRGALSLLVATILGGAMVLPRQSIAQEAKPEIDATIRVASTSAYVQEEFWITISIRFAGLRLGQSIEVQSLPGSQQMWHGNFHELRGKRKISGTRVTETRLFRCKARALRPGPLRIAPVLRVGILKRRRAFIGYTWRESAYDLPARAFTLNVKPLPTEGQPGEFSGAVGQILFDVTLTPTDVAVGDLVKANLSVRGQGYLEEVLPPRISPGRNFRAYDPRLLPDSHGNEKRFEQILVPQSTNAFTVPAVSFSFFDPDREAYRTITRGPFKLTFHEQPVEISAIYNPEEVTSTNVLAETQRQDTPPADTGVSWLSRLRNTGRRTALARDTARARFAPAHSAMILFELRKGAEVRVVETDGRWAKIESNARRGWVSADELMPAENRP